MFWTGRTGQNHATQLDRPIPGASALFAGRRCRPPRSSPQPDTLFGATYLVLAPSTHRRTGSQGAGRTAVWIPLDGRGGGPDGGGRPPIAARSRRSPTWAGEQNQDGRVPGHLCREPGNGPRFRCSSPTTCCSGYGTGAIMAVPGHDQRDWEFSRRVRPADRRGHRRR